MTLDPLLHAPVTIQIHALAALAALLLGPLALYRRRRDRLHRVAGYGWVTAMALTAASGLFIPAGILPIVAGFGPIHLLCLAVFVALWQGIRAIRAGAQARHAETMRSLYWQALGIAGLLTLLPGRLMNETLFGAAPWLGWLVIVPGGLALAGFALRTRTRMASPRPA
ncbi:DUF2306 domain-containing protein [Pseudoponticoccus marisrubri]|uniref:DUF2306 domain-containing protein n=1 Tax=Pseudoponticoccus marisrubri TaxID=1685382 RepID=A0A0W7WN14_9RHOB|nr:DUF2306 domain-containing protein [Pseudoponticoccus marisrubri]KUF11989.1 hypothetical protein AVJ23_05285 [Pseudoponticoccus marisrubri]